MDKTFVVLIIESPSKYAPGESGTIVKSIKRNNKRSESAQGGSASFRRTRVQSARGVD